MTRRSHRGSGSEHKEDAESLSAEDCDILERHELGKRYKELVFICCLKDNPGATQKEWEEAWKAQRAEALAYLVENDGRFDWKEYLKKIKTGNTDRSEQATGGKETELQLDWWQGKIFVQRDSGERFRVKTITQRGMGRGQLLVLESLDSPGKTLAKNEEEMKRVVEEPEGTWSLESDKKVEQKDVSEAKDWKEVERKTEVLAVGDLHGNIVALEKNLEALGVAKKDADGRLVWIGGSKKVILLGDILADRNTTGQRTLLAIEALHIQAKAAGGNIDVICGNHDDFYISFLTGRKIASASGLVGSPVENSQVGDQGLGLLELYEFGSGRLKNYDWSKFSKEQDFETDPDTRNQVYDPVWEILKEERVTILQNMRDSDNGRKILEQICQMKLAVFYDDNLFVHTDVTPKMAAYLLRQGKSKNFQERIDKLNDYFQRNLRQMLFEGKEPEDGFDELRGIFLDTDNRQNFDKITDNQEVLRLQNEFRRQGVNAIFHGHSGVYAGKEIENPVFPIVSIDLGAFKYQTDDTRRSVLRILKSGEIEKGTDIRFSTAAGKQMVKIRST